MPDIKKYILIPYPLNEKRKVKKIWVEFDRETRTTTDKGYTIDFKIITIK